MFILDITLLILHILSTPLRVFWSVGRAVLDGLGGRYFVRVFFTSFLFSGIFLFLGGGFRKGRGREEVWRVRGLEISLKSWIE